MNYVLIILILILIILIALTTYNIFNKQTGGAPPQNRSYHFLTAASDLYIYNRDNNVDTIRESFEKAYIDIPSILFQSILTREIVNSNELTTIEKCKEYIKEIFSGDRTNNNVLELNSQFTEDESMVEITTEPIPDATKQSDVAENITDRKWTTAMKKRMDDNREIKIPNSKHDIGFSNFSILTFLNLLLPNMDKNHNTDIELQQIINRSTDYYLIKYGLEKGTDNFKSHIKNICSLELCEALIQIRPLFNIMNIKKINEWFVFMQDVLKDQGFNDVINHSAVLRIENYLRPNYCYDLIQTKIFPNTIKKKKETSSKVFKIQYSLFESVKKYTIYENITRPKSGFIKFDVHINEMIDIIIILLGSVNLPFAKSIINHLKCNTFDQTNNVIVLLLAFISTSLAAGYVINDIIIKLSNCFMKFNIDKTIDYLKVNIIATIIQHIGILYNISKFKENFRPINEIDFISTIPHYIHLLLTNMDNYDIKIVSNLIRSYFAIIYGVNSKLNGNDIKIYLIPNIIIYSCWVFEYMYDMNDFTLDYTGIDVYSNTSNENLCEQIYKMITVATFYYNCPILHSELGNVTKILLADFRNILDYQKHKCNDDSTLKSYIISHIPPNYTGIRSNGEDKRKIFYGEIMNLQDLGDSKLDGKPINVVIEASFKFSACHEADDKESNVVYEEASHTDLVKKIRLVKFWQNTLGEYSDKIITKIKQMNDETFKEVIKQYYLKLLNNYNMDIAYFNAVWNYWISKHIYNYKDVVLFIDNIKNTETGHHSLGFLIYNYYTLFNENYKRLNDDLSAVFIILSANYKADEQGKDITSYTNGFNSLLHCENIRRIMDLINSYRELKNYGIITELGDKIERALNKNPAENRAQPSTYFMTINQFIKKNNCNFDNKTNPTFTDNVIIDDSDNYIIHAMQLVLELTNCMEITPTMETTIDQVAEETQNIVFKQNELNEQLQQLENVLSIRTDENNDLKAQLNAHNQEKERIQVQIKYLDQTYVQVESEIKQLRDDMQVLTAENQKYELEIEILAREHQNEMNTINSQIDIIQRNYSIKENEYTALEERFNVLIRSKTNDDVLFAEMERKLTELERELVMMKSQLNLSNEQYDILHTDYNKLRSDYDQQLHLHSTNKANNLGFVDTLNKQIISIRFDHDNCIALYGETQRNLVQKEAIVASLNAEITLHKKTIADLIYRLNELEAEKKESYTKLINREQLLEVCNAENTELKEHLSECSYNPENVKSEYDALLAAFPKLITVPIKSSTAFILHNTKEVPPVNLDEFDAKVQVIISRLYINQPDSRSGQTLLKSIQDEFVAEYKGKITDYIVYNTHNKNFIKNLMLQVDKYKTYIIEIYNKLGHIDNLIGSFITSNEKNNNNAITCFKIIKLIIDELKNINRYDETEARGKLSNYYKVDSWYNAHVKKKFRDLDSVLDSIRASVDKNDYIGRTLDYLISIAP